MTNVDCEGKTTDELIADIETLVENGQRELTITVNSQEMLDAVLDYAKEASSKVETTETDNGCWTVNVYIGANE